MAPRSLLPGSERRSSRSGGRVVIRLSCNEVRHGEPYKAVCSVGVRLLASSSLPRLLSPLAGAFIAAHLRCTICLHLSRPPFPLLLFFLSLAATFLARSRRFRWLPAFVPLFLFISFFLFLNAALLAGRVLRIARLHFMIC